MKRSNAIDQVDLYRLVNAVVDRAGGQSSFARQHGIQRQKVHAQLNSTDSRRFTDDVLAAAGIRRVITTHYELIEASS